MIADPIGHSLSPLIHNVAFRHFGLNKVFIPIRVPREDLSRFIDEAAGLSIRGLSVTIPHKEEVVKKLTEADDAVHIREFVIRLPRPAADEVAAMRERGIEPGVVVGDDELQVCVTELNTKADIDLLARELCDVLGCLDEEDNR